MQVDVLISKLSDRLKKSLPGSVAHEPMRATSIGELRPDFTHKLPPKPGAVLILLYKENGDLRFPLTQRAEYVGTHSGQISLPGGKAEKGETAVQTALREANEEIGVDPLDVEVLGTLSDFFVMPSNFTVTPVVGFYRGQSRFKPDPLEVAKILNGSIKELIKNDAIQVKEILAAGMFKMNAPHFMIDGQVVWGATAMMLNELRLILREIHQEK